MNSLEGDYPVLGLNTLHLPAIEALLKNCDLPFEDCEEHLRNFIGMIDGDKLIAIGALQLDGPIALLRSVAVNPDYRSAGLAADMTKHLLDRAKDQGVNAVYLLTETAEQYFTRFGFNSVDRSDLPKAIQKTRQFEFLCPASAQAMHLKL
jgi:amino-acid N-acetyltransferase